MFHRLSKLGFSVKNTAVREQKIDFSLKQVILISKPLENDGVVVLNRQLKFDDHVSSICRKVSTQIDALID